MSLFKNKLIKTKRKVKSNHKEKNKKPKKIRETKTNKYRITGEITLTGNEKNPLKSKMTEAFIKLSYKDGNLPKSDQNIKVLKDKKNN